MAVSEAEYRTIIAGLVDQIAGLLDKEHKVIRGPEDLRPRAIYQLDRLSLEQADAALDIYAEALR
jgi:hypothetical protein